MDVDALIKYVQENPIPVAIAVAAVVIVPIVISILTQKPAKKPWLEKEYKPLPLTEKKWLNHNTVWLRFSLPDSQQPLGLPIGQHVQFKAKGEDGKDVYRSYTPVSDNDQLGSVDFVIKIYPQGKMSQVLNKLEVGQTLQMRGPRGELQYVPNMKKSIGMLAGGTGITPMYQVMNAVLKNPKDKTQITLLYGSLSEEDILLRKELDELAAKHPQQVKVYHVLNTPPAGWSQGSGFITADLIKHHLPSPGPDTLVLKCGPPPMIEAMKKHLEALQYSQDMLFDF